MRFPIGSIGAHASRDWTRIWTLVYLANQLLCMRALRCMPRPSKARRGHRVHDLAVGITFDNVSGHDHEPLMLYSNLDRGASLY